MRAVIHTRYGTPDVLELADVAKPVPADDEVLVKVHATTVNRTDCGFRAGKPYVVRAFSGLRRPKQPILGTELAGEVEAVGSAVTDFSAGDQVFGVHADRFGAHAEYVCVKQDAPLALKPAGMSYAEAAAVCDGVILALTCLRRGGVHKGRRILIYGASGSIGTAAVQLARYFEAHVTAACTTKNVDLVRSLGADVVVDYTREDYTTNGEAYDVLFDAVGKSDFEACQGSLAPGGLFITTDLGARWKNPRLVLWTAVFGSHRVLIPIPKYTKKDVLFLKELIEAGHYRAVIDRTYPLEQVVAATTYVESEQKTGNVVLTVIPDTAS